MIKEITPEAKEIIQMYQNLKVNGKSIQTPYFINSNRRKDLRAMVGKGTPEEMVIEARIWEKLKGVNLDEMSSAEIKNFFIEKGIGIDCSGFIAHVLNYIYMKKNGKSIWSKFQTPDKSLLNKLRYSLRPVENLGAEIITNYENANAVSLRDVQPGDLIRSKAIKLNGDHIMIITSVEYNEQGLPIKLTYTHSSPHFSKLNGIKSGEIKINDISKPLQDQEWLEVDETGECPTLQGFLMDLEDNGLRRLKFSKELE